MDRFGLDVVLAVVVGAWFVAAGVVKLLPSGSTGRRAVGAEPGWVVGLRRVRGMLEVLGGLAVVAGAAVTVLGLRLPFPGLVIGLALGGLAAWTVVESVRPPVRPLRLVLALAAFTLAVFYSGFRD